MESLGPLGRIAEFGHPVDLKKDLPLARDSRFGIRQLPKSEETPSVFSYANPGRGVNGEHLS